MHINVLSQCIPAPLFEGMWRHAEDDTGTGYRSLGHWMRIAQRLEESCVDALFLADIHGTYDVYQASPAAAIRHSVQIPAIDPVLIIPAAAGHPASWLRSDLLDVLPRSLSMRTVVLVA